MPCTTSVIRKACAVVWVCPAGGDSASGRSGRSADPVPCPQMSSPSRDLAHSTSANFACKSFPSCGLRNPTSFEILPFLCSTPPDIVQNLALLVIYAHQKKCRPKNTRRASKKLVPKVVPKSLFFTWNSFPSCLLRKTEPPKDPKCLEGVDFYDAIC